MYCSKRKILITLLFAMSLLMGPITAGATPSKELRYSSSALTTPFQVMIELLADHSELFKQFSDNLSFKKWLGDTIFGATYQQQVGQSTSGVALWK